MIKKLYPGLILLVMLSLGTLSARSQAVEVMAPVKFDVSQPLRDMQPVILKSNKIESEDRMVPNKFRKKNPSAEAGSDLARQLVYPQNTDQPAVTPLTNWAGISNSANAGRVTPPDPAGDVGLNHYVQAVNCMLQIWTKTGTSVYGPVTTSTLWNGFSGNWTGHNDGDAIVLYDAAADRWIISQFAIDCAGTPYTEYELVAVSTTGDPTGTYYRYAFQFDYMPDYPKLGVWEDGYYMAINRFNTNNSGTPFVGAAAAVMQRSKMLTGDPTASMIYFKCELLGGSGSASGPDCYSMLPSDCDGTWAPAGTPNYFTYMNDNSWGGSDELRIWALSVNWTTPASSTFTYVTALPVTSFTFMAQGIPQQGSSLKLDLLDDRLMFRNQYRNFGSYSSFLTCHTVDAGSAVAGVRWYEYRKTGSTWSIYQQATYAPGDGKSRWMGSIAMNAAGDIGLAYTVSSSTSYPSIFFTGRKATDPVNQMTQTEGIIQTGTASMTGTYTRWGDYAAMNVDPSDNNTFWTTHEYVGTYGGAYPWATKVASFKFSNLAVVTTTAATAITTASAQLNGTINPNGLATTYYFQWGTTASYGNVTPTLSAGSGSSSIPVNSVISSLTAGTTYHYRLVGINSEGTSYGNDMTFIPGAALLTTTAATAITATTATSGGNITADGGSAVTARGVCWSTSTNPVATGSHTTDGSGTGTFTSNITGLSANTTYYVRAYATNSTGTWYGNQISFTTACSIYTLPFSESFATTSCPNCWSVVDNTTSGQVWQFGVITGQTPNPNLTGNYAYLNSDAYGSGGSQNSDLVSPTIDMTGYNNITLNFSHYFLQYSSSSGKVYYSINNGTTWTLLQTFNTTSSTNPANFSQTIPALANQSQVKFKWNYVGSWEYYWAIDNISVTGSSALTLTVTPSNQNVAATAGSTSFAVTSNSSWTAVSNQTWCTVTPSGTNNGTIVANYTDNTSTSSRVANITVTVTGLSPVVVTVTQAGAAPTLSVTPSTQNVPATAGSTNFTVTSNSSWTSVSNQTWCTVTASGTGNGNIVANYTDNTSTSSRTANITVTVTGLTPVVVTVVQAGAAPSLTVTPSNQNVPATPAGSTSFTVTANVTWTATCAESWCTVTPSGSGNGTITANYTENTATTQRVAVINVQGAGLGIVSVTVTQGGTNPTLLVAPTNQNVTAPAGSTNFSVTSNSSWTATSDATWCLVTNAGTGNGTINANYEANSSTVQRIAHITVTVAGLPNQIVTVTQEGAAPTLNVTPTDQFVDGQAGSVTFNVVSNSTWTVTSDASWCIVTPSGSGTGTITANYGTNTTGSTRVANITVTVAGVAPQVVKVHQSPATGVTAPSAGTFVLFPNPTTGRFHIVAASPVMEVTVMDMTGKSLITRKCKDESDLFFNISGKAQGAYLVKIKVEDGESVHRLILSK